MQLEGQVALITGAGSGIGKGAALEMAVASAKLAALGRTESQLCDVVAKIEEAGGADAETVEQVGARWGRISRDWATTDNGRPTMGRGYQ